MIIGLNGPMRSGKSEVARILVQNFGFKELAYADLLKESAAAVFPSLTVEDLDEIKNDPNSRVSISWAPAADEGQRYREISITGRNYVQRYGSEAHRDVFGLEFWIEQLFAQLDPKKNYVISDARMENELITIKKYRGINIQVKRHGYDYSTIHSTEAEPDPELIDYTIYNYGTLEELENGIINLVKSGRLLDLGQLDDSNNPDPSLSQQLVLDF